MPLTAAVYFSFRLGAALALGAWGLPRFDSPPGTAPETAGRRFGDTVAVILKRRCVRCHGADEDSGGLRLDSYANVMRGGDRGPAVVGTDATASLLFQKVLRRDRPAMPPKIPLPATEVRRIRAWIATGALP